MFKRGNKFSELDGEASFKEEMKCFMQSFRKPQVLISLGNAKLVNTVVLGTLVFLGNLRSLGQTTEGGGFIVSHNSCPFRIPCLANMIFLEPVKGRTCWVTHGHIKLMKVDWM